MTKHQQGFTLIEVLAAFIVFSLIFAIAMQLTTASINSVGSTKSYNEAALWAESKLTELRQRKDITTGSEHGELNEHFRWELQVSDYEPHWPLSDDGSASITDSPAIPLLVLKHVQLDIYWKKDKKHTRFVTLIARQSDQN